MNQYEHTLTATKRLLCAVGESHWAKWVQDSIERWRDTQDTSYHLSGYAGMGSFTDIYICRQNRHPVTQLQEPWVNTLLLCLQALCFLQLAATLRGSNIFLSDCVGWMRPCPNCGSDDTAAYRWKRATSWEARFEPTDDNLPLTVLR